ncbi:MAG: cyclase family protein [Candidatus Aegiribacteria sp.]|nr:cyclase family protein [Candidatus Aegiribacteria sp.]
MEYRLSPDKLIDITRPLDGSTPSWPGDVGFSKETRVYAAFHTSKLTMSSHCGTHIDPPAHLARYNTFVDDIPLNRLILPAVVVDCRGNREIDQAFIQDISLDGKALILKTVSDETGNSVESMVYSYLCANAAHLAVNRGARIVGIDTLSVDPPDSADTHEILLGASIPILENLLLDDVPPGDYLLLCFPLKITAGDGAPVRAFLQPSVTANFTRGVLRRRIQSTQ